MYLSFRRYIEIYKLLMPYASEIDARTTRCARISIIYTNEIIIYMFFCFKLRLVIFICNVIKADSMGFMHIMPVFDEGTCYDMFDIKFTKNNFLIWLCFASHRCKVAL